MNLENELYWDVLSTHLATVMSMNIGIKGTIKNIYVAMWNINDLVEKGYTVEAESKSHEGVLTGSILWCDEKKCVIIWKFVPMHYAASENNWEFKSF